MLCAPRDFHDSRTPATRPPWSAQWAVVPPRWCPCQPEGRRESPSAPGSETRMAAFCQISRRITTSTRSRPALRRSGTALALLSQLMQNQKMEAIAQRNEGQEGANCRSSADGACQGLMSIVAMPRRNLLVHFATCVRHPEEANKLPDYPYFTHPPKGC